MSMPQKQLLLLILTFTFSLGCKSDKVKKKIISENTIVVFIDGPRLSETWNDPTHSFISHQSSLSVSGAVIPTLKNNGHTFTVPGHVAVSTGNYQQINNGGLELPENPSIFQYWLSQYKHDKSKAWIITSKDKLEVLSNCKKLNWQDKFRPSTDCGVSGLGTGYRHDSLTLSRAIHVLNTDEPNLVLINFREPDYSAHQYDWTGYLNGIINTDKYVDSLWNFIQNHPHYKNKTTLIVTNDHGRHLDGISDEYAGHGDNCDGCKGVSLLALGPDIKEGVVISKEYDQLDLNATLGCLMQTDQKFSKGHVIQELFKD